MPPSNRYVRPMTLRSVPVQVDPSNPGTVIRVALGVETVLNIVVGGYIVFCPQHFVGLLVSTPAMITPSLIAAVRQYGAFATSLAVPTALGIPNTRRGIESRVTVYAFLGSAEVCITLVSLYLALVGGDGSGFSKTAMLASAAAFASGLSWRLLVLLVYPQWLGAYRLSAKEE
ncbi:hypothetical protein AYO20_02363 [Fonsecaea nubica]|uniref:Uncharacterized protein n=1 Tax=Fonsecaea nubica TaxID=856822 RepID=A0A178DAG5_9EURO|nr:hypothetical protein AYO20_02363 [Fonsecaea nubica]OAL38304.1 hypothetical protein AYO20_02363 [Fonsecaea nubica]